LEPKGGGGGFEEYLWQDAAVTLTLLPEATVKRRITVVDNIMVIRVVVVVVAVVAVLMKERNKVSNKREKTTFDPSQL
jgi:hypothetical protein